MMSLHQGAEPLGFGSIRTISFLDYIMPTLTVENVGSFEIPEGKRLVLALTEDAGIDQLHACGGNARCTTCRVEFVAGEPEQITTAEKNLLAPTQPRQPSLSESLLPPVDANLRPRTKRTA